MKYIISVSKTYIHRGIHRHRSNTKKHWFVYYYDEAWKLQSKRVNFIQAMYYKTQKRHQLKRICTVCGKIWYFFPKSKREKLECPNCLE